MNIQNMGALLMLVEQLDKRTTAFSTRELLLVIFDQLSITRADFDEGLKAVYEYITKLYEKEKGNEKSN